MGCLGIGLIALLALAVPASIAGTSLVGAYIVIATLAVIAAAAVTVRTRVKGSPLPASVLATPAGPRGNRRTLAWIGVLAVVYAIVVSVIHGLG